MCHYLYILICPAPFYLPCTTTATSTDAHINNAENSEDKYLVYNYVCCRINHNMPTRTYILLIARALQQGHTYFRGLTSIVSNI